MPAFPSHPVGIGEGWGQMFGAERGWLCPCSGGPPGPKPGLHWGCAGSP